MTIDVKNTIVTFRHDVAVVLSVQFAILFLLQNISQAPDTIGENCKTTLGQRGHFGPQID